MDWIPALFGAGVFVGLIVLAMGLGVLLGLEETFDEDRDESPRRPALSPHGSPAMAALPRRMWTPQTLPPAASSCWTSRAPP